MKFWANQLPTYLGRRFFSQTIKLQLDRCLAGEEIRYQSWFDFSGTGRRYMDVTYSPCQLSDGNINGVLVISHDLTDLKLAEQQYELNQERLENVLQAIPDGVYIVNQEYSIEYVNPVLEKEFGPVKEKKCFQYLHNRTQPCVYCENENVFAGESNYRTYHSAVDNKDYELFESPIKNTDGTLAKVVFFAISQRKKKQQRHSKKVRCCWMVLSTTHLQSSM